jgi:enterochelin esterase family protein
MFFLPFANAQESTDVAMQLNEDGSVVFRYYDPTAKTVKLIFDGDLRKDTETIQNESYHSVKMHRDSNGVWSYTTPVLAPEVYTYQFERDGECIPDPTNPDSIRVRRDKMSVFIIDRTPQTALYVNETLHGQMDTLVFAGTADRKSRMVIVYTPPQYAEGQRNLPVLYLLHGLNGNETAWNDRGRAVQILDNLIAQQKANPMILVMPDVNPECLIAQGEDIGLWENIVKYPSWNNLDFERCYPELDRYLNGIYHFSDKKGSRAVAGLSAGAKQSANLAIMYDSTFSAVGMFSPVAGHKQVPTSTFAKYWIGAGNGDIFYCKINRLRRRMQRNHIPYTMYNSGGGHTWRNWRIYFTEFSQTLFWNIEG